MLGTDKSRGYCLEMICADFLAGAHLDNGDPKILLYSINRLLNYLPAEQRADVTRATGSELTMTRVKPKNPPLRLDPESYRQLCREVLRRDGWRCQNCGSRENPQIHHKEFRSRSGNDSELNLITLCAGCHSSLHR